MNRKLIELLPHIQKYLHEILKSGIDLHEFVLYGSIVSDELTKTSDIDIKIFAAKKGDEKTILKIENRINKDMIKSGGSNLFHTIVSTQKEAEHIENGILMYGKPIELKAGKEGLEEMNIITYNTTKLEKNKRVKLAIRLFGHKIRRRVSGKEKIYGSDGVVKIYNAIPLRNALMVNTLHSEKISQILKDLGVDHKTTRIYIRQFSDFVER